MRRPSMTQAVRRQYAALAGVVLVGVLAFVLVSRPGDDQPGEEATRRSTTTSPPEPSPATTTPTTPAPPTTRVTNRWAIAPGTGPVVGTGELWRYRVEVEDGTGVDPAGFGRAVQDILDHPRGWTRASGISLQRVDGEAEIVIRLATTFTTETECPGAGTKGYFSCAADERAIINLDRWRSGAPPSKLPIARYRAYVVSHEVGHVLGHDHVGCPAPGTPAPVMMQQSKSIGGCTPNPWPVAAPVVAVG